MQEDEEDGGDDGWYAGPTTIELPYPTSEATPADVAPALPSVGDRAAGNRGTVAQEYCGVRWKCSWFLYSLSMFADAKRPPVPPREKSETGQKGPAKKEKKAKNEEKEKKEMPKKNEKPVEKEKAKKAEKTPVSSSASSESVVVRAFEVVLLVLPQ